MRKVAFITGASRGIGKAVGIKLAREGYDIVVAAKTEEKNDKLPGTIYTAASEIEQFGTTVLPVRCDVRDQESVLQAAEKTLSVFGRIDVVVNNAGALYWENVIDTPMRRFDLVMGVNVRGAFAVTSAFLPTMKIQKSGHIIMMSPPVRMDMLAGRAAYLVSKYGMTMLMEALAEEHKDDHIYATALWPKTVIESTATINHKLGDPSVWRTADILADATYEIIKRPQDSNGKALIDEDFLRHLGHTNFDQYLCQPGGQPMDLPF